MRIQSDIKVKKNECNIFTDSINRLKRSISAYEGLKLRTLHCDSSLIHHKYMINKACFFTYKTVIKTQQIRMLCYIDELQDTIVVIKFFQKKKSNSMYHVEFEKLAQNYYNTNLCC